MATLRPRSCQYSAIILALIQINKGHKSTHQTYHTSLEVLQHPPQSIHVFGESITRQSHTRVIGPLHCLVFFLKFIQPTHWRKRLLFTHQHILGHPSHDDRIQEVSAYTLALSTAFACLCSLVTLSRSQHHLRTLLHRIRRLRLSLIQTSRRRYRSHRRPLRRTMPHLQSFRLLNQYLRKLLIHSTLHIQPIRSDTRLTGMPPLKRHKLTRRLFKIRIIKHNKRTIPPQLQRTLLQPLRTQPRHQLPHPRTPRKRNLLRQRMRNHRLTQPRRILQTRRQHIKHPRRKPSFRRQMRQHQTRQRRLWTRFHHHRTARCKRRAGFAQNHRDGEVPWDKRDGDADGLLDHKRASVGCAGHGDVALDSFGFAGEPPCETEAVVEFAVGFSEGFARFVGEDLGDVVFVSRDEFVPFEEELGPFARVEDAVFFEGKVGGFDGGGDVGGVVVGTGCEGFVAAGVDDGEGFVGFGRDPFAVDVGFVVEERGVGEFEGEGCVAVGVPVGGHFGCLAGGSLLFLWWCRGVRRKWY